MVSVSISMLIGRCRLANYVDVDMVAVERCGCGKDGL